MKLLIISCLLFASALAQTETRRLLAYDDVVPAEKTDAEMKPVTLDHKETGTAQEAAAEDPPVDDSVDEAADVTEAPAAPAAPAEDAEPTPESAEPEAAEPTEAESKAVQAEAKALQAASATDDDTLATAAKDAAEGAKDAAEKRAALAKEIAELEKQISELNTQLESKKSEHEDLKQKDRKAVEKADAAAEAITKAKDEKLEKEVKDEKASVESLTKQNEELKAENEKLQKKLDSIVKIAKGLEAMGLSSSIETESKISAPSTSDSGAGFFEKWKLKHEAFEAEHKEKSVASSNKANTSFYTNVIFGLLATNLISVAFAYKYYAETAKMRSFEVGLLEQEY